MTPLLLIEIRILVVAGALAVMLVTGLLLEGFVQTPGFSFGTGKAKAA